MKISFCTACMDRLFHLRETYQQNISRASGDVEFVLLDYNGSDDLESWIKGFPSVKFIRTSEPRYWGASRAKNIAHRAATGDILCNLDCDVLMPEGFADYLRETLSGGNAIVAAEERDREGNYGTSGLVALLREHFFSVNGYDESMNLGWSLEPSNIHFRAKMKNSLVTMRPEGVTCIPHDDEIRTAKCQLKDINFTMGVSSRISDFMSESQEYVANAGRKWGEISDIPPV